NPPIWNVAMVPLIVRALAPWSHVPWLNRTDSEAGRLNVSGPPAVTSPLKFTPPAVRGREPENGTAPTKLICPPAVMSFPTGVESAVASSDPDRLRVAGRVKVPPALTLRLPETAEPAVNVRSPLVWTVTSVAWSTLTVPRKTLSGD